MLLLLLASLLLLVHGNKITNNGVMRIDQDYSHNAPKSSWITIELAHPGAAIKSIVWCKSITPNPKHAGDRVPAPINDCKGSGLTHLQLYPSAREHVRMPADEPNFIYIDPEEIGGWDNEHQFSIIVNADIDKERNAQLMQVVRFNVVPSHPPVGGGEGTQNSGVTIEAAQSPPPQGGGETPPPVLPMEEIFVPPFVKETNKPTAAAAAADVIHPWLATLIVFSIGFCMLLVLGSVAFVKRSKHFAKNKRDRGGLNAYEFDKLPDLNEDEAAIELQPMSGSGSSSALQILMSLGKGANKAFEMNLK
jgi:hypothetical protein